MDICRFLARTVSVGSLFVIFSASQVFAADAAKVSDNGVNVRAGNSTDAAIIEQYDKGKALDVLGYDGEWLKISHSSGGEAYLNAEFAVFEETDAYISKDDVNLRELPDTGSKVLGKFQTGDSITVTGRGNDWYVIDYNGTERYVYADYVTGDYIDLVRKADLQETSAGQASETVYAIVTSDTGLKLRGSASTEAEVLYVMPQDDVMDVIEVGDEWAKVQLDDLVGYAKAEFINVRTGVKPSRSSYSSKGQEVVAYAKQFEGNPYRWGGTSLTKGADCSGFALSVMKHFGVSLSRTSREQSKNGVAVKKSDLAAGDLVFFGYSSIGHVGIYIGDGQFIHAADERSGIIISSLAKRNDYNCARRVLR